MDWMYWWLCGLNVLMTGWTEWTDNYVDWIYNFLPQLAAEMVNVVKETFSDCIDQEPILVYPFIKIYLVKFQTVFIFLSDLYSKV